MRSQQVAPKIQKPAATGKNLKGSECKLPPWHVNNNQNLARGTPQSNKSQHATASKLIRYQNTIFPLNNQWEASTCRQYNKWEDDTWYLNNQSKVSRHRHNKSESKTQLSNRQRGARTRHINNQLDFFNTANEKQAHGSQNNQSETNKQSGPISQIWTKLSSN